MTFKEHLRDIYRTLTPFGWFLFFTLVLVPLFVGFVGGYATQAELIELQSKTNGMEHTDNWEQLHKAEGGWGNDEGR